MPAIEILGLEKSYEVGFWKKTKQTALRDLNLSVEEGEVFGFLGQNGAGKTTTLKILMGLVFPTRGTARLLGRDYRDPDVKAHIGFLPEQPYFYDHLSAPELLEYYAQLSGVPANERKRRVEQMLDRVGLAEAGKLALRKFSKGMLQRAGIAQAILHDPKLVFLDEPMSGLDPIGRREVREIIEWLKDEGKTVFFSTHILSDAEALCDRVAIIHKGELRGVGHVTDLIAQTDANFEVIFVGNDATPAVERAGVHCRVAGENVAAIVRPADLDRVLEILRGHRARIVSVNPIRRTLEEYFLKQVNEPAEVSR